MCIKGSFVRGNADNLFRFVRRQKGRKTKCNFNSVIPATGEICKINLTTVNRMVIDTGFVFTNRCQQRAVVQCCAVL